MKQCKFCRTLYIALVELMVAEDGQPGDTKKQRAAWKKANEVIQQYKYELGNGREIMGKPTMSYKAVESMLEGK